jgi:hypothetical protein
MDAPQIDRQMAGHGHNGLFALCAGGAGAFGQNAQAHLHRRIDGAKRWPPQKGSSRQKI